MVKAERQAEAIIYGLMPSKLDQVFDQEPAIRLKTILPLTAALSLVLTRAVELVTFQTGTQGIVTDEQQITRAAIGIGFGLGVSNIANTCRAFFSFIGTLDEGDLA